MENNLKYLPLEVMEKIKEIDDFIIDNMEHKIIDRQIHICGDVVTLVYVLDFIPEGDNYCSIEARGKIECLMHAEKAAQYLFNHLMEVADKVINQHIENGKAYMPMGSNSKGLH